MQSIRPSQTNHALASMPVYQPHALRVEASHHVLVWASPPSADDLSLAAHLAGRIHGSHTLLTAQNSGGQEPLRQALEAVLATAHAGTHLYLSGTEQQIWRLCNAAHGCGLHPQEISVQRSAGSLCPVYCVHCSTLQESAHADETTCIGCDVRLVIREHFSRLHGAYMGVVADPDHPFAKSQP